MERFIPEVVVQPEIQGDLMKTIFDEIQALLSQKGEKLSMNASSVTYDSHNDPGEPVQGYRTSGVSETIKIPDEYMEKSGAGDAQEFLQWLRYQ